MSSLQTPDHHTERQPWDAWPLLGSPLFALLGVLAVLLGVQASRLETGRTLTASAHSTPLPEFRAATPLPGPTPDAPPDLKASVRPVWNGPQIILGTARIGAVHLGRPSLALYGRRQTEGG